jgi:hypothetical protein
VLADNTLVAGQVVKEKSLGIVFLPILIQLNEQKLLLSQTSFAVPALEGSSEEILGHDGGIWMLGRNILDLLLVQNCARHSIDQHNSVG